MSLPSFRRAVWLVIALLWSSPTGWAHHSPSEIIEALSRRIAQGERTPKLLVRRGDEYRAQGENESAITDYLAALEMKDGDQPAIYGLANAYFAQQDYDSSAAIAERGIRATASAEEAGPFYAIKACAHEQRGKGEAAVVAWRQALTSKRPEVDWFLGEAKSLERLGKLDDACRSLGIAMSKNPSVVLRRTWLEMLVKCGDTDTAAKHIESGLARARWKSSWLLLRAKSHMAQDQHDAARRDAQAALKEINSRLRPETENPFLAADREFAIAVLGFTKQLPAEGR